MHLVLAEFASIVRVSFVVRILDELQVLGAGVDGLRRLGVVVDRGRATKVRAPSARAKKKRAKKKTALSSAAKMEARKSGSRIARTSFISTA